MTSLEWLGGKIRYINQTVLPHEEIYIETADYRVIAESIRNLEIRGAPAIGVASAFGVVLALSDDAGRSTGERDRAFECAVDLLSKTRPTAVNLFFALKRMRAAYEKIRHNDFPVVRTRLLEEALAMQREDFEACRKIGEFGAALIRKPSTLLTHCNTGALATAGTGTALSIIIEAARRGNVHQVYVDETRPLFQGARLTSWELKNLGIKAVLITDSTAGFLMQRGTIDAVLVGADRIAANGDVANKIGTYTLAVLAEKHGVPFYVAAPTSTIDPEIGTGSAIPIEERNPREITHIKGISIATEDIGVYAPAFDITPNSLITAIVTEEGVLEAPLNDSIQRILEKNMHLDPHLA